MTRTLFSREKRYLQYWVKTVNLLKWTIQKFCKMTKFRKLPWTETTKLRCDGLITKVQQYVNRNVNIILIHHHVMVCHLFSISLLSFYRNTTHPSGRFSHQEQQASLHRPGFITGVTYFVQAEWKSKRRPFKTWITRHTFLIPCWTHYAICQIGPNRLVGQLMGKSLKWLEDGVCKKGRAIGYLF